jgi:hypothetical protein
MKNKETSIEELQRKLAEAEALNKQFEKTINIYNSKLSKAESYKKQYEQEKEENKKLKVFISSLQDSFNVNKMYTWASKSERFTSSDLIKLKEMLFANVVKPEDVPNQDIAEAGNNNLDESTDSVSSEDLPKELNEDDIKPLTEPGIRGRQPGVKTCGKNKEVFNHLTSDKQVFDDIEKLKDKYPNKKFTYHRTETDLKIDFIESHNVTRKIVTNLYRDQDGILYGLEFNNPKKYDFVPTGKLTNRTIASVITDKVIYGQPLHLLANKMNLVANYNIVDDQLLGSNFLRVGERLSFFAELIRKKILEQSCFHADETRLKVVNYEAKDHPGSKLGYMWSLSCDTKLLSAVYYLFNVSRGAKIAQEMLEGVTNGGLQVDGYSAYIAAVRSENQRIVDELAQEKGIEVSEEFCSDIIDGELRGVVLVGCLAHARRRISELQKTIYKKKPRSAGAITCGSILALIMKIYKIETATRDKYNQGIYTETEFLKIRKEKTSPILSSLLEYAKKRIDKHSNEMNLLRALNYLINQHEVITNYLKYSDLTPDNNFQERQFRSTIIRTRNNSMFASNERGAKAWAVNATITQCAMMNKINPAHYLKYLLDAIGSNQETLAKDFDYEKLLPWVVDYQEIEDAWIR